MNIQISAEWDEDELAVNLITIEGRPIPFIGHFYIYRTVKDFLKAVAQWQIEQNKANL